LIPSFLFDEHEPFLPAAFFVSTIHLTTDKELSSQEATTNSNSQSVSIIIYGSVPVHFEYYVDIPMEVPVRFELLDHVATE
jgi:hypothetical protein